MRNYHVVELIAAAFCGYTRFKNLAFKSCIWTITHWAMADCCTCSPLSKEFPLYPISPSKIRQLKTMEFRDFTSISVTIFNNHLLFVEQTQSLQSVNICRNQISSKLTFLSIQKCSSNVLYDHSTYSISVSIHRFNN